MKLIEMSVSASCLILILAVLRTLLLHQVLKRTFVVLWDMVLLRLLLPVTLPDIRPALSSPSTASPVRQITQTISETVASTANGITVLLPQAETARSFPWPLLLWAGGAAVCAALFLAGHWKNSRGYQASLPMEDPFSDAWLQAQCFRRPVRIRQSDQIGTPLTYGILHPVILLPKQLTADWKALTCILLHEGTHIRRFDTLRKWLLATAVCLHWFNPLVWLLYILASRDMELACDEAVLHQLGPESRRTYANVLIDLETRRSGLSPLVAGFSRRPTEERITAIMKMKKKTAFTLILTAVLVLGTVTVLVGLDASAAEAADQLSTFEQHFAVPEEPAAAPVTAESEVEPNAAPVTAEPETEPNEVPEENQWLDAYANLSAEEQTAVSAFCELVEQIYGEDIRTMPVTLTETTATWFTEDTAWQLCTEAGTRAYSGQFVPESGIWVRMMCTDTSIHDTETYVRERPYSQDAIDPSSELYQTIASAVSYLDPENEVTQVVLSSGGNVDTQRAIWYTVTRENGCNLEAILGEANGAFIGFKLYPPETDVAAIQSERG